jgi:hypothetical protein
MPHRGDDLAGSLGEITDLSSIPARVPRVHQSCVRTDLSTERHLPSNITRGSAHPNGPLEAVGQDGPFSNPVMDAINNGSKIQPGTWRKTVANVVGRILRMKSGVLMNRISTSIGVSDGTNCCPITTTIGKNNPRLTPNASQIEGGPTGGAGSSGLGGNVAPGLA